MDADSHQEFEAYKKLFHSLLEIPKETDTIKKKHDFVKARMFECISRLDELKIDYRIRD
jgi:hypothetical protein